MYHTSPNELKNGTINKNGIAKDCLFFSDDIYVMSQRGDLYVYEADFNCVNVSELHSENLIADIANYFDCDVELAEKLLDGRESEWSQDFECDGEDSWWLQGIRGKCAVEMGFDGCEDNDEQGTVYIVPMFGREKELKLVEVLAA